MTAVEPRPVAGLATLTVDVDTLANMLTRDGRLSDDALPVRRFTYEVLLPRLLDLFASFGVRATFFLVGRDALDSQNRMVIRRLSEAGHEVANHTLNHHTNFCQLQTEAQEREIVESQHQLEDAIGQPIVGFRAPAYSIHTETFGILAHHGYQYDSSVNVSVPLYAVKSAVLALRPHARKHLRLPSASFLTAPRAPYYPSFRQPWKAGSQRTLLEIPISCVPWLGIPLVGWMLLSGPRAFAARCCAWARTTSRTAVNFALHDYDVLSEADPYYPLAREIHTVSLATRRPFRERMRMIEDCLRALQVHRTFTPLNEVARARAA